MLSSEWTWLSLVKYKRVRTWRPGDRTPLEYLQADRPGSKSHPAGQAGLGHKGPQGPLCKPRSTGTWGVISWLPVSRQPSPSPPCQGQIGHLSTSYKGCSLLTDSSSWVRCRSSWIFLMRGRQKPTAISSFSCWLMPYSCKRPECLQAASAQHSLTGVSQQQRSEACSIPGG